MPPKASAWDKPEFLVDLCIGLYQAADASHALRPEVRDAIGAYLVAGRQTQAWNPKTHEDILISLFQHVKLSTADLQNVMGDLHEKGYTFSESALRTSAMAPTRGWTPAAHEDLLLCFIEEAFAKGDNKKALITGVTEKMKQRGHVFSYDAINQHVQKLRKTRDTNGITAAAGGSTTVATPSKSTPAKTPKSTGGRKRAAPNSAKVKDEIAKEDDDDDIFDQLIKKEEAMSEVEDTPTKPSKRARMKSATPATTADENTEV